MLMSKKQIFYSVKPKQTPEGKLPLPPTHSPCSPVAGAQMSQTGRSCESMYGSAFRHLWNYESSRAWWVSHQDPNASCC